MDDLPVVLHERAAGIHWLDDIAFHILLNKTDKLKRSEAQRCLQKTSATLTDYRASLQLFSAHSGQGVAEARDQLTAWLEIERSI